MINVRLMTRRRWFSRHPVMALLAVNMVVIGLSALTFEFAYRKHIVDFYGTELNAFNDPDDLAAGPGPTILILGDSFSAGLNSYAHHLFAGEHTQWRVINSAVPGTTLTHAVRALPRRLKRFKPQLVIYQTYAGNDLLDLQHPVNRRHVGPLRNLYWTLLDGGASSLGFLNYRLGQLKNRAAVEWCSDPRRSSEEYIAAFRDQAFSIDTYRTRERMLLAANPHILHDQIALEGKMLKAWNRYRRDFEKLVEICEHEGIDLMVLVVPHCTQVHQRYRNRFAALGAIFPKPELLEGTDYPFLTAVDEIVASHPQSTVADPLRALRQQEAQGQILYFNNDSHLNESGQKVLATVLGHHIQQHIHF